jgi:ElaB/YqjD/DUF883 family membrane-anchored ribosome-binding protein
LGFDRVRLKYQHISWERVMASNSSSQDLGESVKEIKAQIEALTKSLADLADDTVEMRNEFSKRVRRTSREAASLGEQIVQEAAHAGNEALNAAGSFAANSANAAAGRVEAQIARNPVTALLVAMGLGLAIGLMTRK